MSGLAPGAFDVTTYGPDGWWTLAALIGDVDVRDVPREVGPGDDIANLRVVITNRVSGIKGVLRPADGSPAVEHEIVIFPFERRYWRPGTPRIRLVQPDIEGQFEVLELPPGDYAVAVNRDITIDPLNEPAGLDALLGKAVKVPVRLGQTTTVTLPMR